MNKTFIGLSVIGVPVSVTGSLLEWSSVMMFAIYCITIIALAGLIGTDGKPCYRDGPQNRGVDECHIR